MASRGIQEFSIWNLFASWIVLVVVNRRLGENSSILAGGVFAFEACGGNTSDDGGPLSGKSRNFKSTDGGGEGFYCPSKNTCCRMVANDDSNNNADESWGCIASDMGARNATCCSDDGDGNTGCPAGYECRRRQDGQSGNVLYDCLRSQSNSSSDDGNDDSDPLVRVLARYQLCPAEENNRKLYGLTVKVPSPQLYDSGASKDGPRNNSSVVPSPQTASSKLAYYSNLGPIESDSNYPKNDNLKILSEVEIALVVVHGTNRNGDDYFCSAKATIGLQNRYPPRNNNEQSSVLVIAPLFLMIPPSLETNDNGILHETTPSSFLYWNDTDKDGTWRYGADATGPIAVSSFDAMDSLITSLKTNLPNLRRIVVAGHSSGGQFVQRWSLLTPPEVWPNARSPIKMHSIVANPSSYAYLTPLRFFQNNDNRNDSSNSISEARMLRAESNQNPKNLQWRTPLKDDCPGYNQWEWGLEDGGSIDVPYRKRAFAREGQKAIVDRFLHHRSVIYLVGDLDRCSKGFQGKSTNCNSHGLETTCADELQGKNRYERNARYWASLELVAAEDFSFDQQDDGRNDVGTTSLLPHKHHRMVVPNVGHDHSMIFQSKEGIDAIYYFEL